MYIFFLFLLEKNYSLQNQGANFAPELKSFDCIMHAMMHYNELKSFVMGKDLVCV